MTTIPPIDVELASRYVSGAVSATEAVAVEQAMDASPNWRALVGSHIASERLEFNFAGITAELDAPRRGRVERLMVRLGLHEHVARLMAATPTLRRSWYLATFLVLLFGLAAADSGPSGSSVSVFLALAPLVPVLGVGLAYGPGVDPAHDMTVATPLSGFRLLLLRTVAVLATSVAFGGVASVLVASEYGPRVVAWMLPALALTVLSLALSTTVPIRVAAMVTGASWLLVVSVVSSVANDSAMFGGPAQLVYLSVVLAAGVALVARRSSFETIEAQA
ncbi:MAG: zf-HC2 domain-containing protein [Acidimicrobiales bacterium]